MRINGEPLFPWFICLFFCQPPPPHEPTRAKKKKCNDLAISNNYICSAHWDGTVRMYGFDGKLVADLPNEISHANTSICVSPRDKSQVLVNSKDNILRTIDLRYLEVLKTYAHEDYRTTLNWNKACYSPDAKYVAAGSGTGVVFIWDSLTQHVVAQLKGHKNSISACAWSPDGEYLMSSSFDKHYMVWK